MLDRGRFTATYKYAVLLGLMDLCLEKTDDAGNPPPMVTTRELAEKVLALYWPHTVPCDLGPEEQVLLQNESHRHSQAEILRTIGRFRARPEVAGVASLFGAKQRAPDAFERLVRQVEWKLIEMPLPRLQTVAGSESEFIYAIGWDRSIEGQLAQVRAYQRGESSTFDNRISFRGRAGEHLSRLNGLLRPLIERQWAMMVARINRLEEARLHRFLFGTSRVPLGMIRPALQELQDNRCFYCGEKFQQSERRRPEVDHFIAWARIPDNGLDNLVAAHERCNSNKRDFLASGEHVERWAGRLATLEPQLRQIAEEKGWERHTDRSLGVARALYLRLPEETRLWYRGSVFVPADPPLLRLCLATGNVG